MGLVNTFTGTKGLGWKPNKSDKKDYDYDMQKLGFASSDLPDEASLKKYVSQVLNQGNTSSCVAHMIAGAIDVLQTKSGGEYSPVSRMHVYYHARRLDSERVMDDGAYIRLAMRAMKHHGIPNEKYWPWKPSKINRRPSWLSSTRAYQRRGGEYHHILETGDQRTEAIKAAINEGYPVGFGTQVGELFKSNSELDVVTMPQGDEEILGGHAILCVGYKKDARFGELFEILNSWGDGYKNGGYVWFTKDYMQWNGTRDLHIVKGWEKIDGS